MAKEQISRTQSVLEAQAILRYSNLHNQNLSLLSGGNPAHHFSEAQLKKALDITMADVAVDIAYSKRIAAEWEKCVALKDCLCTSELLKTLVRMKAGQALEMVQRTG